MLLLISSNRLRTTKAKEATRAHIVSFLKNDYVITSSKHPVPAVASSETGLYHADSEKLRDKPPSHNGSAPSFGQRQNYAWRNQPENRARSIISDAVMQLNAGKPVMAFVPCKIAGYGGQLSCQSNSRALQSIADSGAPYSAIDVVEHALIC